MYSEGPKTVPGAQKIDFSIFFETSDHFLSKSVPIVKIGQQVNFLEFLEVWPFHPDFHLRPLFCARFLGPPHSIFKELLFFNKLC